VERFGSIWPKSDVLAMFNSKQNALEHRDTVISVLSDAFGEDLAWHTHPVLDGCVVRIPEQVEQEAKEAFEEAGFPITDQGKSGDWKELKVNPKHD